MCGAFKHFSFVSKNGSVFAYNAFENLMSKSIYISTLGITLGISHGGGVSDGDLTA